MAEREGFEPPVPFDITGFQDQRLQPLGHLSVTSDIHYSRIRLKCQVFTVVFNGKLTHCFPAAVRLPLASRQAEPASTPLRGRLSLHPHRFAAGNSTLQRLGALRVWSLE